MELPRETENLKQMLDTGSNSAKDSDSTNGRMEVENTTAQETVENIENVAGSENQTECCTVCKKNRTTISKPHGQMPIKINDTLSRRIVSLETLVKQ